MITPTTVLPFINFFTLFPHSHSPPHHPVCLCFPHYNIIIKLHSLLDQTFYLSICHRVYLQRHAPTGCLGWATCAQRASLCLPDSVCLSVSVSCHCAFVHCWQSRQLAWFVVTRSQTTTTKSEDLALCLSRFPSHLSQNLTSFKLILELAFTTLELLLTSGQQHRRCSRRQHNNNKALQPATKVSPPLFIALPYLIEEERRRNYESPAFLIKQSSKKISARL